MAARAARPVPQSRHKSSDPLRGGLDGFAWRLSPKLPRTACLEPCTSRDTTRSSSASPAPARVTLPRRWLTRPRNKCVRCPTPTCWCWTICSRRAGSATPARSCFSRWFTRRYKLKRSIVVTSNRLVQDWGKYFGDNTMATTILDRLLHRAHLLEFKGKATVQRRPPAG